MTPLPYREYSEKQRFHFAIREEQSGRTESALQIYSELLKSSHNPQMLNQVHKRKDAAEGRGPWAPRAELFLSRIFRELSDPLTLLTMGIGGAAFRLGRAGMMAHLTAVPSTNFFRYGFGARAAAGLFGFMMEAPTFTATGHMAGKILGRPAGSFGHDLASSLLTLGSLRLTGWAGTSFYRIAGGAPGLGLYLSGTASMFGGILLSRYGEHWTGLHPLPDDSSALFDSLLMVPQFQLAGMLTRIAFGRKFAAWEHGLDQKAEALARKAAKPAPAPWNNPFAPMHAMAGPAVHPSILGNIGTKSKVDLTLSNVRMEKQSVESSAATEPEFYYPPHIEKAWRHLEERWADPNYYEGSREDLAHRRPDPEAVNEILLYQAEDYGKRIPGARVEILDAEVLLEPPPDKEFRTDPHLFREALRSLGDRQYPGNMARRIVRVYIPKSFVFSDAADKELRYLNFYPPITEAEHFLRDKIRMVHIRDEYRRIDFTSLSLLEAFAQTILGKKSVQFHPVPGNIPRDRVMALRQRRSPPAGFARGLIFLGDIQQKIHPSAYTAHDVLFHGLLDANNYDPFPAVGGWIYFRAKEKLPEGHLRENLLNQLADSNVGQRRSRIKYFSNQVLRNPLESALYEVQGSGLQINRERILELQNYIQAFQTMVREDFRSQPHLAGKEKYFISPLQGAEQNLKLIGEVTETTHQLGITVPPPLYHGKALSVIRRMEKAFGDPKYLEGSREELLQKRVDLRDADPLWFHQLRDYANLIPGAEYKFYDSGILLREAYNHTEPPDPQFLREALSQLSKRDRARSPARQVLVIKMPADSFKGEEFLADYPHLKFLKTPPMVTELEHSLGERVHLLDAEEGWVIYRIPSLSLTEKLLQTAHGSDRIQLHPVPGVISQDRTMALRGDRVEPMGFSFGPFSSEEFGGPVHPVVLPMHDVEHAAQNARLARGVPEISSALYKEVQQFLPNGPLKKTVLARFSDLSVSALYQSPLAQGPSDAMAFPLSELMRQMSLSKNPYEVRDWLQQSHEYADAYDRLLKEVLPFHPVLAPHVETLAEPFKEARRILPPKSIILDLEKEMAPPQEPMRYSQEMKGVWRDIEKSFQRKDYLRGDPKELLRKRPDGDLVDGFWIFQAQDGLKRFPGSRVTLADAEEVFLPHSQGQKLTSDPKLLRQAMRSLGERGRAGSVARQVLRVEIPNSVLDGIVMESLFGPGKAEALLATLPESEKYLGNRLQLVTRGEETTLISLPTLSLWESLLRARYGSQSIQFHYVRGSLPQEVVMGLRGQRTPPIGLSYDFLFFGDVSEMSHPTYFTIHDAYGHAGRDATRSPGVPELSHRFYRFFRGEFGEEFPARSALDRLSDLDEISNFSPDVIFLMGKAHQRSLTREDASRGKELIELKELSNELLPIIRRRFVPGEKLEDQDKKLFQDYLELRRTLHGKL